MEADQGNITPPQPRIIDLSIMGGEKFLTIRPWSMKLHDELFPLVMAAIDRYTAWDKKPEVVTIGTVATYLKDEIRRICERTVRDQLRDQKIDWDADLWGEDFYGIAQAIWNTSIIRPGGGGIVGKGMGTIAPLLLHAAGKGSATTDQIVPKAPDPQSASSTPIS